MSFVVYKQKTSMSYQEQVHACLNCRLPVCVYDAAGGMYKLCPISGMHLISKPIQHWCGIKSIDDCVLPIIEGDKTTIDSRQVNYQRVRDYI